MKPIILSIIVALAASPSLANDGAVRLGCFKKAKVPAKYRVERTKIKDAVRKYRQRGDVYELVEYPAVYKEDKYLVKAEYYVMKEVACR